MPPQPHGPLWPILNNDTTACTATAQLTADIWLDPCVVQVVALYSHQAHTVVDEATQEQLMLHKMGMHDLACLCGLRLQFRLTKDKWKDPAWRRNFYVACAHAAQARTRHSCAQSRALLPPVCCHPSAVVTDAPGVMCNRRFSRPIGSMTPTRTLIIPGV